MIDKDTINFNTPCFSLILIYHIHFKLEGRISNCEHLDDEFTNMSATEQVDLMGRLTDFLHIYKHN